jgi:DNA-binding CsgD family transcriptional regulator
MPSSKGFSHRVALILSDADRKIRALSGESHYRLYHNLRVTMGKICPVDAFYVGLFQADGVIVFPYNFDEPQEYDDPEIHTYGENGLSSWILKNRAPYLYNQDGGILLNRGPRFGDTNRLSADVLVVPIFDINSDPNVIGLASVQSYQSDVYTDEHVRAFQFLVRSIVVAMQREKEDAANREILGLPETLPLEIGSVAEVVEEIIEKMRGLRRMMGALRQTIPSDQLRIADAFSEVVLRCEQIETDTMEILTRPSVDAQVHLRLLTPREREVADRVVQGCTNDQIAEQLYVTTGTVKKHVTSIMRKFQVRQRSEIRYKMQPLA